MKNTFMGRTTFCEECFRGECEERFHGEDLLLLRTNFHGEDHLLLKVERFLSWEGQPFVHGEDLLLIRADFHGKNHPPFVKNAFMGRTTFCEERFHGKDRADRLVGKATITGSLRLGRSEVLGMRKGHRQSDQHWNCFNGNIGETPERWGGAHMGATSA